MNDQRKTKKQLLEDLERERERSLALQEVSKRVAAVHDTDEILNLIVNEAARLVGGAASYIRLLEGDVLVASAATESAAGILAALPQTSVIGESTSPSAIVMATKNPRIIEDAQVSELTPPDVRSKLREHGFHGTAVIPLLANDRSIGVLAVLDRHIRRFAEDEVSLLQAFADQAALALEKARLLNEAETERERAETERERADSLYRISNLLAGAHTTDEVLDLIVNEAARLLGASGAYIRLLNGGVLVPSAATESTTAYLAEVGEAQPSLRVEEGTSFMGQVMATKKPWVSDDVTLDELVTAVGRQKNQEHGFHGAAAVALLANDQPLGVLSVVDKRIRRFTEDEVSLLSAFADQAALALEKARLLNEAEREKERSDALYRVSNLLAGAHDTDEVLDLIVNEAARLLGANKSWIRLLQHDGLVLAAATETAAGYVTAIAEFTPAFAVEEGANNAGHAMATKEPLIMEDAVADGFASSDDRRRNQEYEVRGSVVVPLVANDRSIGVLMIADRKPRRFTDDEVSLLTAFADQAALAIEKARLLNEAERERERLVALNDVVSDLATTLDFQAVSQKIVDSARSLIGARIAIIFELNQSTGILKLISLSGNSYPRFTQEFPLSDLGSVRAYAARERQTIITRDFLMDDRLTHTPEQATLLEELELRAFIGVPFIVQDRVTGTLAVGDLTGRTFSEDEIELTEAFANQAAVALEHARLLGEAERRTAELDATNQELEAFSYSVSHDLRAPLRGIDGFSQALMNEYSDVLDEQAQHYLERVRTGSERMGQLIDDLLALSQVTRGEMRRENVDLSDLARTIVTGLQERDPQRQVEFVIQDGVVLNGDTRLLRVALENLLGNAWKYTGKHDQARIEFGLTEDDGKRTCFIRDDGSGFDMAYADRLFGAFQRLHDASEFEGSGIGLATVQRIINRHGGRIWAESAVDEGATFFFTLH
ncbi:MAG: GAF domain-containing protein [Chloroflexi bacterium]|nr:GAF domain-containing protein [Chloroflexota bacterium]